MILLNSRLLLEDGVKICWILTHGFTRFSCLLQTVSMYLNFHRSKELLDDMCEQTQSCSRKQRKPMMTTTTWFTKEFTEKKKRKCSEMKCWKMEWDKTSNCKCKSFPPPPTTGSPPSPESHPIQRRTHPPAHVAGKTAARVSTPYAHRKRANVSNNRLSLRIRHPHMWTGPFFFPAYWHSYLHGEDDEPLQQANARKERKRKKKCENKILSVSFTSTVSFENLPLS